MAIFSFPSAPMLLFLHWLVECHLYDGFQFGDIEWFLEEVICLCFFCELGDVAVGAKEDDGYGLEVGCVL